MNIQKVAAGCVIVLGFSCYAYSANYEINNPASRIENPAAKIINPASKVENPAASIYNPATQMNNPSPISPVVQPVPHPEPVESTSRPQKSKLPPQERPEIPRKAYAYKTVKRYIAAAKKAFAKDDYMEFMMVTDDAIRRIRSGTLKATSKEKIKLNKYKAFGYGLLEEHEESDAGNTSQK